MFVSLTDDDTASNSVGSPDVDSPNSKKSRQKRGTLYKPYFSVTHDFILAFRYFNETLCKKSIGPDIFLKPILTAL